MSDDKAPLPSTLFHYTTYIGMTAIVRVRSIDPSLAAANANDVRYGDGQYLSDVIPGIMTPPQLSRLFIGQPFQGRRFTQHVEIDVGGLAMLRGRPHVYVVPNTKPLDTSRRLRRFGSN